MDIWISGYASGTVNVCTQRQRHNCSHSVDRRFRRSEHIDIDNDNRIEPLETHQNATVDDPASCMGTQTEQVRAMAEGNKKAKCRPSIAIDGGDGNDRIQQVQRNKIIILIHIRQVGRGEGHPDRRGVAAR